MQQQRRVPERTLRLPVLHLLPEEVSTVFSLFLCVFSLFNAEVNSSFAVRKSYPKVNEIFSPEIGLLWETIQLSFFPPTKTDSRNESFLVKQAFV